MVVAGGLFDARSKPSTPDPQDATLSKRAREEGTVSWRHKLHCAVEKAMPQNPEKMIQSVEWILIDFVKLLTS